MFESQYIRVEMEQHPEAEYHSDLRILRRFVQNGSFGYRESDDVVFQTLKKRYPEAYGAFGREREREVLGTILQAGEGNQRDLRAVAEGAGTSHLCQLVHRATGGADNHTVRGTIRGFRRSSTLPESIT